jgi:hypothetical protein
MGLDCLSTNPISIRTAEHGTRGPTVPRRSYPFDGHMIPTWPAAQTTAWQPGTGAHLDNYGGNGWTGGLNHGFVITAYLQDIDERGGCFTYWPRSHYSVHEYFRANPTHIDGSFEHSGLDTWRRFWTTEPHASRGGVAEKSKHTGVQFSGKRGDVVICTNLQNMLHGL